MVAHEYNPSVYRLLVFWREVLAGNGAEISVACGDRQRLKIAKTFVTVGTEFGIATDHMNLSDPTLDQTTEPADEDVGEGGDVDA